MRFSTLNGRIPGAGIASQIGFTAVSGLNIVTSPYKLVADPGNTSSRSFFTATVLDNLQIPNVLTKVVLYNDYNIVSTINNVTLS